VNRETRLRANHPSFFFAHDAVMARWLSTIRSIAVLPDEFPQDTPDQARAAGAPTATDRRRILRVVRYRPWRGGDPAALRLRSREEIAEERQLYAHTATIHSVLHFAWFVGCAKVRLVGCDGLPSIGYDPRLPNLSQTEQAGAFFARLHQDRLLRVLALSPEYVGTPPHLLHLEATMAIRPDRRDEFQGAMRALMLAAGGAGGCRHASLSQVGTFDVFLMRITWDGIRRLIDFVERYLGPWTARPRAMGIFRWAPSVVVKTELVAFPPRRARGPIRPGRRAASASTGSASR
jgi:hypothetical protein